MNKTTLFLCCFFASVTLSVNAAVSYEEQKFAKFESVEQQAFRAGLNSVEFSKAISDGFRDLYADEFSRTSVEIASLKKLRVLFAAANKVNFYASSSYHAEKLELIFNELRKRGALSGAEAREMYSSFIGARNFKAASLIRSLASPVPPALPTVDDKEDSGGSTVFLWDISLSERKLSKESFSFPEGPLVIIVSSPLCHFSEYAVEALRTNARIRELVSKHGKFIVPQDNNFDFDLLQNWRKDNPMFDISFVDRHAGFPEIHYWNTPSFYFFYDGVLKHKFSGWPQSGRKGEFLTGLEAIKLRPFP